MKTTLEISDSLLVRAKRLGRKRKRTLRSLVEEGLTKVLEEQKAPNQSQIKPVTFCGKGLSPQFQEANWNQIRDAAYKGHGS